MPCDWIKWTCIQVPTSTVPVTVTKGLFSHSGMRALIHVPSLYFVPRTISLFYSNNNTSNTRVEGPHSLFITPTPQNITLYQSTTLLGNQPSLPTTTPRIIRLPFHQPLVSSSVTWISSFCVCVCMYVCMYVWIMRLPFHQPLVSSSVTWISSFCVCMYACTYVWIIRLPFHQQS